MKKIFLVFLILALGIGSYAYFRRSETIQTAKPSAVVSSFFPTVGQKQDVTDVGTSRISLTGTPGNTTNTSVSVGNTSGGSYGNTPHAISIGPVAGFTVLQDVPNKGSDTIRYVDRASGFVYEQAPNASPLQISNIRLPNIYEAVFAEGGKSVLLRFLGDDSKTIGTYYVPIPEPDTTGVRVQAKGIFLPNNIGSLVVFSHGKKIAFTTVEKGSSIVRIANPNGSQPQMFFSYPFTDWLLLASDADLYLQTKAYSSFPGTLFSLTKNDYKKIISHVSGLTALVSPSGHYVLSATTGGATPIV